MDMHSSRSLVAGSCESCDILDFRYLYSQWGVNVLSANVDTLQMTNLHLHDRQQLACVRPCELLKNERFMHRATFSFDTVRLLLI